MVSATKINSRHFIAITIGILTCVIITTTSSPSSPASSWMEQNSGHYGENNTYGAYRTNFPSPSGGIIYRYGPESRRQSRNPNAKNPISPPNDSGSHYGNGILIGEICDPADPSYNKCTRHAQCISLEGENNLHRCNCTLGYESTSDRKCRLAFGERCENNNLCNYEAGLLCIDNRCECENSELYQYSSRSCRSKVGGSCTPSSLDMGIRFSKSNIGCVKNAVCQSHGPNGLSFRCTCKKGYVESRNGYCAPGVGLPCNGKGDCDNNIPLVCKQGKCACRDSLHVYDPVSNSCVGLAGAMCCSDPGGQRCVGQLRTGCIEGAFCKEVSLNLPGRCVCLPYNIETEERLCKPSPN